LQLLSPLTLLLQRLMLSLFFAASVAAGRFNCTALMLAPCSIINYYSLPVDFFVKI